MSKPDLPEEFLRLLASVKGKRARIVVDHILEHGAITTEELENQYGYRHPPRAVRDVREQGIPIETFRVKNEDGLTIAAYRFANPDDIEAGKLGGRSIFSKQFKSQLYTAQKGHCAICNTHFEARYLQIDHRIPYEVSGDADMDDIAAHMLLCASCNRAKSWSCEQCSNSISIKDETICNVCYWASPSTYDHIAMQTIRRLDLTFQGDEVVMYDRLKKIAENANLDIRDYIKRLLDQPDENS